MSIARNKSFFTWKFSPYQLVFEGLLKEALRKYGDQGATGRIMAVDLTKAVRASGKFQNQRGSFGNYCPLKAQWPYIMIYSIQVSFRRVALSYTKGVLIYKDGCSSGCLGGNGAVFANRTGVLRGA